jgi:CDP-diacylglycerol--glycerol-3-phosphate 3-phosphatidyltransferase
MIHATVNLPNALTGVRLLSVPVLGVVLVVAGDTREGRWAALALFVGASLTDVADGWLARRRNQCTAFGALADPIADKALVATSLLCLSARGLVPWWATAVVLAREAAVTTLRLAVLHRGVIPASRGGKAKTAAQTTLIVLALAVPGWTTVLAVVVAVTVLWTVATGLDYGLKAGVLPAPRWSPRAAAGGSAATGGRLVALPAADGRAANGQQRGGAIS